MRILNNLRLKAKLRLLFTLFLAKAISMLPVSRRPSGILIVRLDAIGDFVLWQRGARALRELYPDQRLILVANSIWAPLARSLPHWDEVIPVEVNRFQTDLSYCRTVLRKIRENRYAGVLQPTYSRALLTGDLIVLATGAKFRIGVNGNLTNISARHKIISDRWYTSLINVGQPQQTEVEHNQNFLREIGWNKELPFDYLPKVSVLDASLKIEQIYFIVFPGASWSGRQWPISHFVRLIETVCVAHPDWLPVLCGSPGESALCEEIKGRSEHSIVNLAGRTSLPEFCELVRGASLLVGNETSAVHIAAAVETPSVCILGGGHFGRFVPYPSNIETLKPEPVFEQMACFNCDWNCRMPHRQGDAVPCIENIRVEDVYAAIGRVLPMPLNAIRIKA